MLRLNDMTKLCLGNTGCNLSGMPERPRSFYEH